MSEKILQYIDTYCIIQRLKFGENLGEPSHLGHLEV